MISHLTSHLKLPLMISHLTSHLKLPLMRSHLTSHLKLPLMRSHLASHLKAPSLPPCSPLPLQSRSHLPSSHCHRRAPSSHLPPISCRLPQAHFIGGDMGWAVLPHDPLFYFHHNGLDRLRRQWQAAHRDLKPMAYGYPVDAFAYTAAYGTRVGLRDCLGCTAYDAGFTKELLLGACRFLLLTPAGILAPSGSFWLLLAPSGSFWLLLAPSGSLKAWLLQSLGPSDCFLLLLTPSHSSRAPPDPPLQARGTPT